MNTDGELHQNSRAAIRKILSTMFSETTDTRIVARSAGAGALGSRTAAVATTTTAGVNALKILTEFVAIGTNNTAFVDNLAAAVTANTALDAPIATIAGKADSVTSIAAIISNTDETKANLAIDINSNTVDGYAAYSTYTKALVKAAATAATANAAANAAKFNSGSAPWSASFNAAINDTAAGNAVVDTGGTATFNDVVTKYGTSATAYATAAAAVCTYASTAPATASTYDGATLAAATTALADATAATTALTTAATLAAYAAYAAPALASAYTTLAAAYTTLATAVAIAAATYAATIATFARPTYIIVYATFALAYKEVTYAYIALTAATALTTAAANAATLATAATFANIATAIFTTFIAADAAKTVITAADAVKTANDVTKINAAHAIAKIAIAAASTTPNAPTALKAVAAIIAAAKKINTNSETLATWIVCGSPERIITSTDFTGDLKTYMSSKSLGFRIQVGASSATITLGTKSGEIWTWSTASIVVTTAGTGNSWISAATTTSAGIPIMLVKLTFTLVNSALTTVTAAPASTADTWTALPEMIGKSAQAESFSKNTEFGAPTATVYQPFQLRDTVAAGGSVWFVPGTYSRTTTKSDMTAINSSFENALDKAPYTHLSGTLKFGSSDKPYATYSTTIAMNATIETTKDVVQKTKVDASSNGTFVMTASFVGNANGTITISGTNEFTGTYSFTQILLTKAVGAMYTATELAIDMSAITDTVFVARLKGRTARLLVAPSGAYMRAFMAPTAGPSVEPTGTAGTIVLADKDSETITLYSNQQAMKAVDFSEKWLSCAMTVNFASATPLSFLLARSFGIFGIWTSETVHSGHPCVADMLHPFGTGDGPECSLTSASLDVKMDFTATIRYISGGKVKVDLDFSGGKYAFFGTATGEFDFATLLTPGNYGGMLHLLLLLDVHVLNGVLTVGLAPKGEVVSSTVRGTGDGVSSAPVELKSGTKVRVSFNAVDFAITVTGDGPGHVTACQIARHRVSLKNPLWATVLCCPNTTVGDFCIDYISHSVTGIIGIRLETGVITVPYQKSAYEGEIENFLTTENLALGLTVNATHLSERER